MEKRLLDIRKYLMEIKVGIFLLGAAILVFITAISLREVSFLKGSYIIKIKFDFAEGLRAASPVRFCGVDVGEIKKTEVKEEDKKSVVYVYTKIAREVRIPKDSSFFINSLSLFGEKYLEIIPPDSKEEIIFLKDGDEVVGISSTPLFNIIASFHKTMIEFDKFIKENEVRESLKDIIINVRDAAKDLHEILSNIRNEEGTLGKFIYDDSLYTTTEEFIQDLKLHPWKLLYKPKEKRKSKIQK